MFVEVSLVIHQESADARLDFIEFFLLSEVFAQFTVSKIKTADSKTTNIEGRPYHNSI